eukprot:snap_masked-scaffold_31-processed-gene-2.14-mRNA-1 protein AED:1.00 eAED:1.00 QI:0/0/0/0/1/1/2/0/77
MLGKIEIIGNPMSENLSQEDNREQILRALSTNEKLIYLDIKYVTLKELIRSDHEAAKPYLAQRKEWEKQYLKGLESP